jgi:hypothetical protein
MNAKEKKEMNEELSKFHTELESWLVSWFKPTSVEITATLNEKFAEFQKKLKL